MSSWSRTVGIVNLTPDSFSDGAEASTPGRLRKKIAFLRAYGSGIFDFGAQSTAPGADAIDRVEEMRRFGLLFECFSSLGLEGAALSIDTYRPSTFASVREELGRLGFRGKLIWNDISGVLDAETMELLGDIPGIGYVLCATDVPSKREAPLHRDFCPDRFDPFDLVSKLKGGLIKLSSIGFEDVILDAAFGFSKTPEQSMALLRGASCLVGAFDRETRWMWGLSRKSMFRSLVGGESDFFRCELMHLLSLAHIAKFCRRGFFRVHDPRVSQALGLFGRALAGASQSGRTGPCS